MSQSFSEFESHMLNKIKDIERQQSVNKRLDELTNELEKAFTTIHRRLNAVEEKLNQQTIS